MGRGRAQKSIALVATAAEILREIQPASVRAVCYQLFVRGHITGMDKNNTNRVGTLLTRAREEGDIPWAWIVQEGRVIESVSSWDDPAAFARTVQGAYRRNKWAGQPTRLIVVSEKGTVRGTLTPVLDEYEVDFLPVGGYASATRVKELADLSGPDRQPLLVLYIGDHDPSGRGMSDQDLPSRLARYASGDPRDRSFPGWMSVGMVLDEFGIGFRRIALTVEDTRNLGRPLSFPASDKADDTRYPWFVKTFGPLCWELDAMNPNVLRDRVRGAVMAEMDLTAWQRYVAAEEAERESIAKTLEAWRAISGLARK